MTKDLKEYSLKQAMYANYKGETEAHIRASKGYAKRHRHGTNDAHTRKAWKTAWNARLKMKGFTAPNGTYERIARTRMMGVSKSKPWHKYMKRADSARMDPSIPYGMKRAGRDPRFRLTIGEQERNDNMTTDSPSKREFGTTSLTDKYAEDTPGQKKTIQGVLAKARVSIQEARLSTSTGSKTASRGSRTSSSKSPVGQSTQVNRTRRTPTAIGHRVSFGGRIASKTMKTATGAAAREISSKAANFAARLAQKRQRQQNKSTVAGGKSQNAARQFPR